MTLHAFTALGFDPAPGDAEQLGRLGSACSRLGAELAEDARATAALASGFGWRGGAADAFRHCLRDVPRDLLRASDAYVQAGAALTVFASTLEHHQTRARLLERRAQAELPVQEDRSGFDDLVAQARGLRADVLDEANRCGRQLRDATRHAPKRPGWFSAALDSVGRSVQALSQHVGEFVRRNAGAIAAFATFCAKISSTLAVVAMLLGPIPVLGTAVGALAFAGSLATGSVALLSHAALATYAGGGWMPIVMDVAGLALAAAPKVVEHVAERVIAARGLESADSAGLSLTAAVSTVHHPLTALKDGAGSVMSFPTLVTRTISLQFDLSAGSLGIVDLSGKGLREEVAEAQEHAEQASERLAEADELLWEPAS